MKISEKLKDFKARLSDRHMFSVVLVMILALTAAAVYEYKKSVDYRYHLENQYNRAFSELVSSVDSIENNLAKGAVVTDAREMVKTANQIYSQSAFAAASLAQLPVNDIALSNTSKFLSQVGDYTYGLSLRYMDGGSISNEEYDTLVSFGKYAKTLSDSLSAMQASLYSGTISFGELEKNAGSLFSSQSTAFADDLKNMESQFTDYPSLIYDGPFSDHIQNSSPKLLEGGREISLEEAQTIALAAVGEQRQGEITYLGEANCAIAAYSFSVAPANTEGRSITVDVTKINGMVSWMLDNRGVSETVITADDAKAAAKKYLETLTLSNMRESYHEINNNICTANFAAEEDGVLLYPDLVKVRVAMDTGEILGAECSGYIMNHRERKIPSFSRSESEILSALSPKVTPLSVSKCLIPLDSGREVFCYEVKCTLDDRNYLIYLNSETLRQENILMLLISENGTLTI